MIWHTTKKSELEQIKISRSHDHGTIIWQIWCRDDDDKNIQKKERNIIQNFIDQIIQNYDCVITGLFCEKYLDDINKKYIDRKIDVLDKKLIKWNKKRQKKKIPEVNYYYLKNFNINWDLFEMAPWDFGNITIWPQKNFNENIFEDRKKILDKESKAFCKIGVVELDSIELYISDELAEYRDNLFKELQNLGYQIVETKFPA